MDTLIKELNQRLNDLDNDKTLDNYSRRILKHEVTKILVRAQQLFLAEL
jgi:hypothetical protein